MLLETPWTTQQVEDVVHEPTGLVLVTLTKDLFTPCGTIDYPAGSRLSFSHVAAMPQKLIVQSGFRVRRIN